MQADIMHYAGNTRVVETGLIPVTLARSIHAEQQAGSSLTVEILILEFGRVLLGLVITPG